MHAWFSVSQKLTFAFSSSRFFPVRFAAKRYILQKNV